MIIRPVFSYCVRGRLYSCLYIHFKLPIDLSAHTFVLQVFFIFFLTVHDRQLFKDCFGYYTDVNHADIYGCQGQGRATTLILPKTLIVLQIHCTGWNGYTLQSFPDNAFVG